MKPKEPKRTIVVATDGSSAAEEALKVAVELARTTGDKVVLVSVWQEFRADFGIPLHKLVHDLIDVPRDLATEILAAAAAEAEAAGVESETVSRHGSAAKEICAVAREREARLIAIGSTGLGSIEGALLGSLSRDVLHHAPCPVLVVPAPRAGRARGPHPRGPFASSLVSRRRALPSSRAM